MISVNTIFECEGYGAGEPDGDGNFFEEDGGFYEVQFALLTQHYSEERYSLAIIILEQIKIRISSRKYL